MKIVRGFPIFLIFVIVASFSRVSAQESEIRRRYFNLFYEPSKIGAAEYLSVTPSKRGMLSMISEMCPRGSFFGSYDPNHKKAVGYLASLYSGTNEMKSFLELSQLFKRRPEVHPHVWYASFLRAQCARFPSTLSMARPSPINIFPSNFFPDEILRPKNTQQKDCRVLDERFGKDNGVENKLWYFREDVQLNAHHWNWHLLFPGNTTSPIDRRGEFFYFFHHDIMARYTAERLSNGFEAPVPFDMDTKSVVEEGYNPHLTDGISTLNWAPRKPFQKLSAVLNATLFQNLVNQTNFKDRVIESIFYGHALHEDGYLLPIHTDDNTNVLGELAESSIHSINSDFYGVDGYHSEGHYILSNIIGKSPQGVRGVMGHAATAMRDVIFYRWHQLVDEIFIYYKETHLVPYDLTRGEHPLVFSGIKLTDISVTSDSGGYPNHLTTYFSTHRFDLDGGLDFNSDNSAAPPNVKICAKHLDHGNFTYRIQIVNQKRKPIASTIRIFLAPRFKSLYDQRRFSIIEQRKLFFTMDSFVTILNPGDNVVIRRSVDSTVTAPWPKSIQELKEEIEQGNSRELSDCECGYPHHLLLPRGTKNGMRFDLFAMATDASVDQTMKPTEFFAATNTQCVPSHVHCGIPGQKYPDSKPMGYPFDRVPYTAARTLYEKSFEMGTKNEYATLDDFVRYVPNMATNEIIISHNDV